MLRKISMKRKQIMQTVYVLKKASLSPTPSGISAQRLFCSTESTLYSFTVWPATLSIQMFVLLAVLSLFKTFHSKRPWSCNCVFVCRAEASTASQCFFLSFFLLLNLWVVTRVISLLCCLPQIFRRSHRSLVFSAIKLRNQRTDQWWRRQQLEEKSRLICESVTKPSTPEQHR